MEKERELQKKRSHILFAPLAVSLVVNLAVVLVYFAASTLCEELSYKITGNWPVQEGTIVGWCFGYCGGKGSVRDIVKGYHIRNRNIQKGEMVRVTVRMAINGAYD